MRTKPRVNWTIDPDVMSILKQTKKINGNGTSISSLVEHAVRKTFQNKIEALRDQARYHQLKIIKIKDEITTLEKQTIQKKKEEVIKCQQ